MCVCLNKRRARVTSESSAVLYSLFLSLPPSIFKMATYQKVTLFRGNVFCFPAVKSLSGLPLLPQKERWCVQGSGTAGEREDPSWPCHFLRGRRSEKTGIPDLPQPLLPTHPLPIARRAQPGLARFSSCRDKTRLRLRC